MRTVIGVGLFLQAVMLLVVLLHLPAVSQSRDAIIDHVLTSALAGIFSLAGIAIFLRSGKHVTAHMAYGVFVCATIVSGLLNISVYPWSKMLISVVLMMAYGLATSFVCQLFFSAGWRWGRLAVSPYMPLVLSLVVSVVTVLVSLLFSDGWMIASLSIYAFISACMVVVTGGILFGARRLDVREQPVAGMTLIGIVFALLSLAIVRSEGSLFQISFAPSIVVFIVFYVFVVVVAALFAGIIVWSLRWLAVRALYIMLLAVVASALLLLLLAINFVYRADLILLRTGLVALFTYRLFALPLLILPQVCCYALMHYQLSGKAGLLSRQFIRCVLWFFLASCFGLVALIVSILVERFLPGSENVAFILVGCFIVSLWLFPLAWAKVRDIGDQMFYRDFYHYNRTLRDLSMALTHLHGLDQMCAFILPRLTTLLNSGEVALLVKGGPQHWQSYHYAAVPPAMLRERFVTCVHRVAASFSGYAHEPLCFDDVLLQPLYERNVMRGCLCVGPKLNSEPYSRQDKSFLATLAAQLGVLEANTRYLDQVRANAQQLAALNHRMVSAQEDERRHLALELHDEVLQQAMLLARQLAEAGTMTEVAAAMPLARSLVSSLRDTCLELRPPLLDELGLAEALRWLAQQTEQRGKIRVEIQCSGVTGKRSPDQVELALYRVAQEAFQCAQTCASQRGEGEVALWFPGSNYSSRGRQWAGIARGTPLGEAGPGRDGGTHGGHWRPSATAHAPWSRGSYTRSLPAQADIVLYGGYDLLPESQRTEDVVTILLADDHTMMREGTRRLLEEDPELVVVGEASDGAAAVVLCQRLHPTVLILDIAMKEMNGFIAAQRLLAQAEAGPAILVLTGYGQVAYVQTMLRMGVKGYWLKSARGYEIRQAVHEVAAGKRSLSPEIRQLLADEERLPLPVEPFTSREREVLQLVVQGLRNSEIAERLHISVKTVESHLTRLYGKLGVQSRAEAIASTQQQGLLFE